MVDISTVECMNQITVPGPHYGGTVLTLLEIQHTPNSPIQFCIYISIRNP